MVPRSAAIPRRQQPAMGKNKAKKPRKNEEHPPHSQPSTSTLKRRRQKPRDPGSDSDCSPPSSPAFVRRLLEPYAKLLLLSFLVGAASDPGLLARLSAADDVSPSHRKLFVHGLPPHADDPTLAEAFSRFAPLADYHVVADRATRHCKGPDPSGGATAAGRRVYVTNIGLDASAEGLRTFFARFGELEGRPFMFDAGTGRSRGYALFVYHAADGAMKALEEPYRVFEGRTLHCQLANDPAKKNKALAAS